MSPQPLQLSIASLRSRYLAGTLTPRALLAAIRANIQDPVPGPVWLHLLSQEELAPYLERLEQQDPATLPLYGIPFAIKDNIDLAGIPTTAACPDFSDRPETSAAVVEHLIEAGALPVGKTNLDQFATGLVGTRSPHGATPNAFNPAYLSVGSSSGSAVAVARGLVSFALGTDTAGSGRVPAAFNNLIGLKPSRGLISTRGVLPACRTLDCVSLFTLSMADAEAVMSVAAQYDPEDPFARPAPAGIPAVRDKTSFRFGVPSELAFFDDQASADLFAQTVDRLRELGGTAVEIDFAPFAEAARLLYEGPWVAERYAAIQDFVERTPEALHEVTRAIIAPAIEARAVDAFKAQYRLAALKRRTDTLLADLDCVLTPTTPTIYRIDEEQAEPIKLNSRLGTYTNFVNLLDLTAIAVPAGFRPDGLPFGVTLFGPAFSDAALAQFAERLHQSQDLPLGATPYRAPESASADSISMATAPSSDRMHLVVCGAHLSGLALNHQLLDRGGRLLEVTTTASCYRFFCLPGGPPYRPGLIRAMSGGGAIEVEVWSLPRSEIGDFLAGIPAPLGLGKVELDDGRWETGFICEGYAADGAQEITGLASWRRFLQSLEV
jgi:allophanate hydrolase